MCNDLTQILLGRLKVIELFSQLKLTPRRLGKFCLYLRYMR